MARILLKGDEQIIAAGIGKNYDIQINTASYSLSGNDANLYKINASQQSYVITGTTVSLQRSIQFNATQQSYSITGTTTNLDTITKIAPTTLNYNFVFYNVGLVYSGAPATKRQIFVI